MSTEDVEKFFSEVPNQSPGPVINETTVPVDYDDIISCIDEIYKNLDYKTAKSYKAGKVYGRKKDIDTGRDIFHIVVSCYINELRNYNQYDNKNSDKAHEISKAINNFQTAMNGILNLSDNLNLNVDVNSVLAIIHGAVTELSR